MKTTQTGGRRLPPVSALLLVLVMGLLILWLGAAALTASEGGGGLGAAMLPTALRETALLMGTVGVATGILGLVAAWLVTHFEFPGRRIFEWALILPLAVPTYLAAYSYVEFLDFTGPVQQVLRWMIGANTIRDYWFPGIKSPAGGAFVLSLVLYPYVYVACRSFFLMQSGSIGAAARTLGASGARSFFTITLPLSRPALIVGMTLAMMEVVNDLGAVQYFGVNSLTAVIYSTWINRSNFGGAAQLAVTIVIIIAALILAEQWARRDRVYMLNRDNRVAPPRESLAGRQAWAASMVCGLLLLGGFGVPFGQLLVLALRNLGPDTLALTASAGANTVLLASIGALVTVVIGYATAKLNSRPGAGPAVRVAAMGYAIPGTVLALGLLQPLGQLDLMINRTTMALFDWRPGLVLSGSIAALIYVYAIRFLAVSYASLEAGMKKRGDSMLDAGRVLGATGWRLLFKIDLPTLSPAILSAATLVFVEIVKELPATLLLRPLGVETLATVVYARANVSLFTEAALPALAIVVAGLVPVILGTSLSDRR